MNRLDETLDFVVIFKLITENFAFQDVITLPEQSRKKNRARYYAGQESSQCAEKSEG